MNSLLYKGIIALFFGLFLTSPSFGLTWPSPSGSVTTGYGLRIPPTANASRFHRGLDISTGGGPTPLLATADGEINEIVFRPGYGNTIRWGGNTGWSYNHLSNSQTPNWIFGGDASAKAKDGSFTEAVKYVAINTSTGMKYYVPYNDRLADDVEIRLGDGSRHPASCNINESHPIAYSGDTGIGTGVHLHLTKYKGSGETNTENPLKHYYSAGVRSNLTPPGIANVTYDRTKTIVSADIDTRQERDLNEVYFIVNNGQKQKMSFDPERYVSSNGSTTGIKAKDTDVQKHAVYYSFNIGEMGCGCGDQRPEDMVSITVGAVDIGGNLSERTIEAEKTPCPTTPPGCENPDDNYSVSSLRLQTPNESGGGGDIYVPGEPPLSEGESWKVALYLNPATKFDFS